MSAAGVVACVDVGSTFTKAVAVGADGSVLAAAQHPTTVGSDVLVGLDAAVAGLGMGAVPDVRVLACSSAGGGLRLAVVGQERVISAEAGRRVALSAGARVVAVTAGELDASALTLLAEAAPDVVLLVGGTDGGDAQVLLHNAGVLGGSALRVPVVVAGNAAAVPDAARLLRRRGRVVTVAGNVIPRIGELAPGAARAAIREVFIRHVIGGKGLSRGARFPRLVLGATPDVVLAGVEVVADVLAQRPGAVGDVLVVDIGGATTDVYSVLEPGEDAGSEVVGTLWRGRTVEGDLGMRWSAPDVVAAAERERLPVGATLGAAARRRHGDVGFLPGSAAEAAEDVALARLAAVIAVRRHARPGAEGGRDLSRVGVLIGSGGVLRHAPASADQVLGAVLGDLAGGWRLPERAAVLVDTGFLLAPIGLLALRGEPVRARAVAAALLQSLPRAPH
ncbi:MAG TPA: glutamate mutase L [Candidatus Nanopelagicales bacterium]